MILRDWVEAYFPIFFQFAFGWSYCLICMSVCFFVHLSKYMIVLEFLKFLASTFSLSIIVIMGLVLEFSIPLINLIMIVESPMITNIFIWLESRFLRPWNRARASAWFFEGTLNHHPKYNSWFFWGSIITTSTLYAPRFPFYWNI